MSNETMESPEEKKLKKAEAKAIKKAKKAAKDALKAEKKAKRKAEKEVRESAAPEVKSEGSGKKLKSKKAKAQSFSSAGASLGAKVQSVARQMRAGLATQFLEHGLYAGQEQVLFLLDEHGPLALTELAEKLDVRAPTITKTVTRMEAQSFLSRATSRDDARSIIISLTPEGRKVLKMAREIVENIEAKAFSALSIPDCESLSKNLDLVFLHIKTQE